MKRTYYWVKLKDAPKFTGMRAAIKWAEEHGAVVPGFPLPIVSETREEEEIMERYFIGYAIIDEQGRFVRTYEDESREGLEYIEVYKHESNATDIAKVMRCRVECVVVEKRDDLYRPQQNPSVR